MDFRIGDYVTRQSYNSDIIFKINKIETNKALLRSYRFRLMADAPLDDLIKYETSKKKIKKELLLESYDYMHRQQRNLVLNEKQIRNNSQDDIYRERAIKVLHLDGDKDYLDLSLQNYKNLNIRAKGIYIPEKGQPEKILDYLNCYQPDILVLTGHDGELNGKFYHTSEYFVKAVKKARSFQTSLDELVIFAGACQSSYTNLIESGANFASSPANKLIHFLDPVLIVEKIAFTSIREVIRIKDVVKSTVTGEGGIGGIETRGKLRLCYP